MCRKYLRALRIPPFLVSLAAAIVSAAPAQEEAIAVDGSTTVGPIATAFAEYLMEENPGLNITVSMSGSGNGIRSLINSEVDVATASRFIKPNEVQAAVDNGVLPIAHVVALDGIAVIVHPSNRIDGLSLDQVRAIYTGGIENWTDVGGPDLEIVVVSRDTNSGTYETFEELVMGEERVSQGAEYVGSNGAVRSRVQETPAAIGYVGLGYVDETVRALEIDGVKADPETVILGEYPIARPLFLFTNGYPPLGSMVHRFVTLHLTEEGQEMVESIGFVPMTQY
ncbi:phosphate ABC transporter substrate-binding protein [Candidatus Sumerlaeota bacterium]|nr:phosphate ABC transporter substrate-binding protein [Candidatus Sumerlaeota bacterium]